MKKLGLVITKFSYIVLGFFMGLCALNFITNQNPISQEKFAYLQGCTLGQSHLYRKQISKGVDPAFCLKQGEVFEDVMESSTKQMDLINSQTNINIFL